MPILHLPHKTADYLCPINGLADIYEWNTGERIPDRLLFYARSGFMLISNKKADPPKMINFYTSNVGRKQYEFWSEYIGYTIHSKEGGSFKNALREIKSLVDNNIPVILFGLDMYHLEYQTKFYHKMHVPGHIILMVGFDENYIYIHDNSKEQVQKITENDLEKAWAENYLNISKKNAYFGIEFSKKSRDSKGIIGRALKDSAGFFLNPPVGMMGVKGFDKLINEFPEWHKTFDAETMEKIYRFFVFLTGSILPEIPKKIDPKQALGFHNPHKATRDLFAKTLIEYSSIYDCESWVKAAGYFAKSGEIIEAVTDGFCDDIVNKSFSCTERYVELFKELKETETNAFKVLAE